MKFIFKLSPIAVAIAAMCGVSMAMAESDGQTNGRPGFHKSYNETVIVRLRNTADVHLEKEMIGSYFIDLDADIDVRGRFDVYSAAAATVDDKQISHDNEVINKGGHENESVMDDWALENASGNIGVNIGSGDNNIQDNAVAIAVVDEFELEWNGETTLIGPPGSVDAEAFVFQDATKNVVKNKGTTNKAEMGGSPRSNPLANAKGNIAVNMASGNSNLQKNNLAMAVGPAVLATASTFALQQNGKNFTKNKNGTVNTALMAGGSLSHASGNIGINIAAGTNNLQNNSMALTVKKMFRH